MADDLGSAAGMIAGKAVEGNLLDKINQMENRIAALEGANTVMADVGEVTDDLGDIRAGRILALSSGYEPTDSDATGVVIDAEGIVWGDDIVNIIGLNTGVMMFCMSALDGKLKAAGGALTIDDDGITMLGLRYGIKQITTADGATRYGMLETFVPPGDTKPAFGMTFSDNAGEDVMVNGTFETGDLTGWTQSASSFSVVDKGDGTYCAECAAITGADETLTSDRIVVAAGDKLQIGWKTKDSLTETTATLQASEDTYLNEEAKTTNYGSEATLLSEAYVADPTTRKRPLLRFDFSSLPSGVTSKPNFTAEYLQIYVSSITAADFTYGTGAGYMMFNGILKNWVEAKATWNLYKTGSAWSTAGALGSGTDYTNDTSAQGITSLAEGWNQFALSQTMVKSYIGGTFYGLVLRMLMNSAEFAFDSSEGTNPPELYLTWDEPSAYTVSVKWYDDASAGSLLRTDVIGTTDNLIEWTNHSVTIDSPTGALSAEIVITASAGEAFWLDDFVVYKATIFERILLKDDGVYYQGSDSSGTVSRLALASEIPTRFAVMGDEITTKVANWGFSAVASLQYGGYWQAGAADCKNGDEYTFSAHLAAGTYTLYHLGRKAHDKGIIDWYLDGSAISGGANRDWYAATAATYLDSFSVTVSTSGYHVFKAKVDGKNGSSSDYVISVIKIWGKQATD